MTLTNYWWLLIWLFAGGLFLTAFFPKKKEIVMGKEVVRWRMGPAIALALPYIIWAGWRSDGFGDTYLYRKGFLEMPYKISEIPSYLIDNTKDKGFSALSIFIKAIIGNSDVLFFLIVAAFQMLCLVYVYRRYSENYWLCMFLFIASTDYMSWMHNGIRQFIAAAIMFACFNLMLKKRYVPVILMILLASLIHGSALIMIPILFIIQGKAWNKRTLLFILIIVFLIAYIDQFTPFLEQLLAETQYNNMISNEIWANDDGTNILRVLVYSMPAILSLVTKKYIDRADDPVINMCVNCSAVTMALYLLASVSSGIYIGRLPIYTTLMGYIAVPWMINNSFTKRTARMINIGMVGAFFVFFYYQMNIGWGIL